MPCSTMDFTRSAVTTRGRDTICPRPRASSALSSMLSSRVACATNSVSPAVAASKPLTGPAHRQIVYHTVLAAQQTGRRIALRHDTQFDAEIVRQPDLAFDNFRVDHDLRRRLVDERDQFGDLLDARVQIGDEEQIRARVGHRGTAFGQHALIGPSRPAACGRLPRANSKRTARQRLEIRRRAARSRSRCHTAPSGDRSLPARCRTRVATARNGDEIQRNLSAHLFARDDIDARANACSAALRSAFFRSSVMGLPLGPTGCVAGDSGARAVRAARSARASPPATGLSCNASPMRPNGFAQRRDHRRAIDEVAFHNRALRERHHAQIPDNRHTTPNPL